MAREQLRSAINEPSRTRGQPPRVNVSFPLFGGKGSDRSAQQLYGTNRPGHFLLVPNVWDHAAPPKPSQARVEGSGQAKPEAKKSTKKSEGDAPTKAELACAIFIKIKGTPRKDVVQALVSEAGLTVAGAATYYANCKRDAE